MADEFLPKISIEAFKAIIMESDKVLGEIRVGSTTAIVLKGNKFIGKRMISLRDDIPEIDYEYAVAQAHKAGQLSACMQWFEDNKNFKEGGYIVADSTKNNTGPE